MTNHAAHPRPRSRRLRGTLVVGGLTVLAALAVIGIFVLAASRLGIEFKVFSKEPVETFGGQRYTGYFAHVVVLVWQVSATAALLAGVTLRLAGHRAVSTMLLAGGALSALMVVDDFFLLHEYIYPRVGIHEEMVYVAYGLLTAAFAWAFRRRLGSDLLLLGGAYACWAASVTFDFVQETWGIHLHLGEDGVKAIGTALWSAFMIRIALRALLDAIRSADGASDAGGPTTELIHNEQR